MKGKRFKVWAARLALMLVGPTVVYLSVFWILLDWLESLVPIVPIGIEG